MYTCGLVAVHLSFAQTSRVGCNRKHIWALNLNNFGRPAQNPSLPLWLCMCRLLAGSAVGYVFAVCLALPFAGFPERCLWLFRGVAVRWFSPTMPIAMSLPLALPFAGFPERCLWLCLCLWRCRSLVFPPVGGQGLCMAMSLRSIYYRCYNSKFAMCLPPVYWRCRLARLNCSHAWTPWMLSLYIAAIMETSMVDPFDLYTITTCWKHYSLACFW